MRPRPRPISSRHTRLLLVVVAALTLMGCGKLGRGLFRALFRVGAAVVVHAVAAAARGAISRSASDTPLPAPQICFPDEGPICAFEPREEPERSETSARAKRAPMPAAPPPIPGT